MGAFWHPFADMAVVDGHEFLVERGDGPYVFDPSGRRYLDAIAALWFCNVGYGRDRIVEAVAAQMRRIPAYHTFGDFATRPTLELADRIASLAPFDGAKVFLTSGGSDAVDTAAKLARRYFAEVGQPERTVLLAREYAYHGMHAYGTSLAGIDANRTGVGPLVPDVISVPYDSVEAVAKTIEQTGPERIAGIFCEPVIGAGGVRFPPDGYLEAVQDLIHEAGGLFIADEVVTGFGRLGDRFGSGRLGLRPDLITFAKGVTSGYQPLGGVVVAPHVAEPFWSRPGTMFRHGYTYSGHAAACAAALANLDILEEEDLYGAARRIEADLPTTLAPLLGLDLVTEIRTGVGALAAVQLDPDRVEREPDLPYRVATRSRDLGVITRAIVGGGLQISPPLVVDEGDLATIASTLAQAIEDES